MILNDADDMRLGSTAVSAVYLGGTQVWSGSLSVPQLRDVPAPVILGSATQATPPVPAGLASGDLVLLHVMTRSALTIPSGWDVLASLSRTVQPSTQWHTVLARTITDTALPTLTQAAAGRFVVGTLAVPGGQATAYPAPIPDQTATSVTSATTPVLPVPRLMLYLADAISAPSGDMAADWTSSVASDVELYAPAFGLRIGAFAEQATIDTSAPRTLSINSGSALTAITLSVTVP